jgi:chitin-binding protein
MSISLAQHRPPASSRWVTRALVVVTAALLLITTMLVDVAFAHGSTIDPASRNYGCWKRWGSNFQSTAMATQDPMCWQAWQADPNAMWNWNGLYREGVAGNHQGAIPDGQLCSGGQTGGTRYAALDTPGNWVATNVNNSFTLKTHDQALHGADYYRVYVTKQGFNPLTQKPKWSDLELLVDTGKILPGVGTKETDGVLNGVTVSIPVTAPGRTGRHIVYTIWQASHSDQSYYWCADVNFPGGSNPSSAPTTRPAATTRAPASTPPVTSRAPATSRAPITTAPVTSRAPQTSAPATSRPPVTGGCAAAYSIVGQWQGGFQAEVTVTAGATALTGWTVTWTFANGQAVTQSWGATITSSGSTVTARNVSYNGSLAAGATTSFGFLGSANGTNAGASVTCTPA